MIGGFRYRLLDGGPRRSVDVDYHWEGDLDAKQREVIILLRAKLLPEVRARYGYDGSVGPAKGPDAESVFVRTIETAFPRPSSPGTPIIVPVEITRIICLDAPVVRTVKGTVCLTASDADMIESKVISLLNRIHVRVQDIVDLFLFRDTFLSDSGRRLGRKLSQLKIEDAAVERTVSGLVRNRVVHVRAIDRVIEEQLDEAVAANIMAAGGGAKVFDVALEEVAQQLRGAKDVET
ncbi:MAG: hypothetical protein HQ559_05435 [Lentisphaerae bacterium]|nr:hypothetical protein [Lentisphaerota bacterium]